LDRNNACWLRVRIFIVERSDKVCRVLQERIFIVIYKTITKAVPNVQASDSSGFLQNWFFLFWDLYSAAPEKRDSCEASQEAKAFHEFGFMNASHGVPTGPVSGPMMNGMHSSHMFPSAAPSPLGMGPGPGGDGMMPGGGYYPPRSAQPGPSGSTSQASPISGVPSAGNFAAVPPRYAIPAGRTGPPGPGGMPPTGFPGGAPPHIFAGNEQMRTLPAQRLPPNAGPMRMAYTGMRPNGPMRYTPPVYMDSPANAPFSNTMMPNGAMCSSSAASMMSSPGPGGPMPSGPESQDPRNYMMMPSASSMQYMHPEGSMTPGGGGRGSAGPPCSTSDPQMTSLLNGDEMKHSPASAHGGISCGTPSATGGPGSQAAVGGPGSVAGAGVGGPGSVHSQSGGSTGGQGGPSISQGGNSVSGQEEASEISKIKQSLFDDMKYGGKEESAADSYHQYT
uniref:ARID domain-containing protein n=1 Tax=Syphacia muris TaxID=451379 RepID=A0A0N5ABV6_9BILA